MHGINKNLKALWVNHHSQGLYYVVLEGGTRSGKTFSCLEYLLTVGAAEEGLRIGIFRADQSTCKDSVIADALKILEKTTLSDGDNETTLGDHWTYQKSELRMISSTGSVIKFGGTNDPQKLHGPQWDIVYINEAMEVSWDAFAQLQQRCARLAIIDFNPSKSKHWVFDQIMPKGRQKVLYVHSTFKDNPHLSQNQIESTLSYEPTEENRAKGSADPWRWDVYGLGKRGYVRGAVYDNWSVRYDGWPADQWQFQKFGWAIDYGYSVDPTVLISVGMQNNNIYVREHCYEPGMLVLQNRNRPALKSLERIMQESRVYKDDPIIAESANPESNAQLQALGYNVIPVKKGPNSILEGINIVRGHHIFVHSESLNVQTELEEYKFREDKHGYYSHLPEDKNNHAMDALRYWALYQLRGASTPMLSPNGRRSRPKPGCST